MEPANFLFSFALIALVSIGLFLLIRSIMLWYWKVDTIVENLQRQFAELQKISRGIEKLNQTTENNDSIKQ